MTHIPLPALGLLKVLSSHRLAKVLVLEKNRTLSHISLSQSLKFHCYISFPTDSSHVQRSQRSQGTLSGGPSQDKGLLQMRAAAHRAQGINQGYKTLYSPP